MSGGITGYTEVRELDFRLTERTVLAVHDATGDHVIVRYLSEDVHIEEVRERLGRLYRIDNRYVVRVREVVLEETRRALVLEPVDGMSLRAILDDQGVMTVEAALYVLRGSLCGLAAAHAAAVTHRAYRPESVLVGFDGEVRLFDFGVSAVAGAGDDAATDIYAAVITFVEIVTGAPVLSLDIEEVVSATPVALRGLVRTGLAENVNVVAVLASLDATAVAEYGGQWVQRGRLWLALRVEELRVEQLRAEAALVEEGRGDQTQAVDVAGLLAAEELRLRRLRDQELRERLAHAATVRAEAVAADQRWAEERRGSAQAVTPSPSAPAAWNTAVPAAPVAGNASASAAPAAGNASAVRSRRHVGRLVMAGTFVLLICGGLLTWFVGYRDTPAPSPRVPVAGSPTGSPSAVPAVPAASESPLPSPSASTTRQAPLPPAPTGSWSPVPKGRSEGGVSPTPGSSSVTVTPSPTPSASS